MEMRLCGAIMLCTSQPIDHEHLQSRAEYSLEGIWESFTHITRR